MTFRCVNMMLPVVAGYLGCTPQSESMNVRDKAQILEQIEQTPLKAKELCSQLQEPSQKEFCIQFALQALPKDALDVTRELCSTLEGTAKGECWFQVAENSLDVEDCEKASPFVEECYGHITIRALIRSNVTTWKVIEHIAKSYRLDLSSPIYGTVVYQYWFRDTSPLKLDECKAMKHPKICIDGLGMLYLQRLKEWDLQPNVDCSIIPDKLAHSNQLVFEKQFLNVYERKCGSL